MKMIVVTSSPSRAMVHSACSVYMRAAVGLEGHAPGGRGRPPRRRWPAGGPADGAAGEGQPVVAGAPAVAPGANRPAVLPSSDTMAPSGSSAPTHGGDLGRVEVAGRQLGPAGGREQWRRPPGRPTSVGQRVQGADGVVGPDGQHVDLAALGHQVAGLARVGEERHRRLGVDQHQVPQAVELHRGELGQVGEALRPRAARRRARGGRGTSRPAAWRRWRWATRLAATRPRSRSTGRRGAGRTGSPERSAVATLDDAASSTGPRGVGGRPAAAAAPPASDQLTSAGRISVATCPGGPSGGGHGLGGVAGHVSGPRPTSRIQPRHVAGRPSRCRTRAGRRTACGRWRGRRRC